MILQNLVDLDLLSWLIGRVHQRFISKVTVMLLMAGNFHTKVIVIRHF
jgi:hypothetical protein